MSIGCSRPGWHTYDKNKEIPNNPVGTSMKKASILLRKNE
jgi:hypothetical protein